MQRLAITKAKITFLEIPTASIKLQEISIFLAPHRIPTTHSNIMYLYWGHSASTGRGRGVDEESNKKQHRQDGVQSKSDVLRKSSSIYFIL